MLEKLKLILELGGKKTQIWVLLCFPLAVISGALEIVFGVILGASLASFGLATVSAKNNFDIISQNPALVLGVAALIRTIASVLTNCIPGITEEMLSKEVRERVAYQSLVRPAGYGLSSSDAAHILSNLLNKTAAVCSGLVNVFSASIVTVLSISGALMISPLLACFALFFGAAVIWPPLLIKNVFQYYSSMVYREAGNYVHNLVKASKNRFYLEVCGRIPEELSRLYNNNHKIFFFLKKYLLGHSIISAWPQFMAVIIIIATMAFNQKVVHLQSDLLLALIYCLYRGSTSVGQTMSSWGRVEFNGKFVKELHSKLINNATESDIGTHSNEINGVILKRIDFIEVNGLQVHRGKNILISDLSINIKRGDFVLIQGVSGKGKTSLFLTLLGLLQINKGSVKWNGSSISDLDHKKLYKRCAYLAPDVYLIEGTVKENLLFGLEAAKSDRELIESLELSFCDYILQNDLRLDYRISDDGEGISAGQRQRLAIARAFLRDPDVFFFDEATSNLDIALELKIINNFRERFPQAITLAVSHRDSLRSVATQLISLS